MWYWYIANSREVFADLDLSRKSLKRMKVSRARILGAKLDICSYVYYESSADYHYHLMIECGHELTEIERGMWESRFCDDMFRNVLNTARIIHGGKSQSLLISSEKREGWREPDFTCQCESKHKSDVMKNCPIAIKLDCCLSEDFFGSPIYDKKKVRLGQVERIKRC